MSEYVSLYVSKEKADEFKKLKGVIPDDDILQQYIDKTKSDIEIDLDNLDYDMLQYKATLSKWHKEMKSAYEELSDKGYNLWEEFDKNRPNFNKKMEQFLHAANPVKNVLTEINQNLTKINMWQIDKLLELIRTISMMSGKEKEMLQFLMTMGK